MLRPFGLLFALPLLCRPSHRLSPFFSRHSSCLLSSLPCWMLSLACPGMFSFFPSGLFARILSHLRSFLPCYAVFNLVSPHFFSPLSRFFHALLSDVVPAFCCVRFLKSRFLFLTFMFHVASDFNSLDFHSLPAIQVISAHISCVAVAGLQRKTFVNLTQAFHNSGKMRVMHDMHYCETAATYTQVTTLAYTFSVGVEPNAQGL